MAAEVMDLDGASGMHDGLAGGGGGEELAAAPAEATAPAPAAGLAGAASSAAGAEDAGLASLSLPHSAIRRIIKSVAPGARFSSEAVAGFHRIAQAFVLFAADRALVEMNKDLDKARKSKIKGQPTMRRNLSSDHIMRFLTSEMPPVAAKVASLFPDLMSAEFKPPGVRLLEELREQEGSSSSSHGAAASKPQSLDAFGLRSQAEAEDDDRRREREVAAAAAVEEQEDRQPPDTLESIEEPACEAPSKKRQKTSAGAPSEAAAPPPPPRPAPAAPARSLTSFFGKPRPGAAPAPVPASPAVAAAPDRRPPDSLESILEPACEEEEGPAPHPPAPRAAAVAAPSPALAEEVPWARDLDEAQARLSDAVAELAQETAEILPDFPSCPAEVLSSRGDRQPPS